LTPAARAPHPPVPQAAHYLARFECLARGDLAGAADVRGGRASKAVRDATESILASLEEGEGLLQEDEVARAKRCARLRVCVCVFVCARARACKRACAFAHTSQEPFAGCRGLRPGRAREFSCPARSLAWGRRSVRRAGPRRQELVLVQPPAWRAWR
jgi:hypothetical protein